MLVICKRARPQCGAPGTSGIRRENMGKVVLTSSVAVLSPCSAASVTPHSHRVRKSATTGAAPKALVGHGQDRRLRRRHEDTDAVDSKGEEKFVLGIERAPPGRGQDDPVGKPLKFDGPSGQGPLHGLGQQQGSRVRDGVRRRPRQVEQVDRADVHVQAGDSSFTPPACTGQYYSGASPPEPPCTLSRGGP